MPTKIPGYHGIHVHIEEEYWTQLQTWCASGVNRVTAKLIMNTLLKEFYRAHIAQGKDTGLEDISASIAAAVGESIKVLEKERKE